MANAVKAKMTGIPERDFEIVCTHVRDADIVMAVWQDPRETQGVGLLLIKGEAVLDNIATNNVAEEVTTAAIPCGSVEQAEALRQVAAKKKWWAFVSAQKPLR